MNYHRVQIATRGLIPGLFKRGPIADILLDIDMINNLVNSGVEIYTMEGKHITATLAHEKEDNEKVKKLCPDLAPVAPTRIVNVKQFEVKSDTPPSPVEAVAPIDVVVSPEPSTDEEPVVEDPSETDTQAVVSKESDDTNPEYAGLSKNQIKRLRREAAAKAADATTPAATESR